MPAFRRPALLAALALTGTLALAAACGDEPSSPAADPDLHRAGDPAGSQRVYGAPIALGQGRARSYVLVKGGVPLEVGLALTEAALEGLPAHGHGEGAHGNMLEYLLEMPAQNPTPFRFVELDWNPAGHEPEDVYGTPHFDFHFYTISRAQRDAIDPADPQYQQRADHHPAADLRPGVYAIPVPPGTPTPAIPRMGVHWVDMRSPELQGMLGHPELARPFTTTFIQGSWDGQVTFFEPMITRAFIVGRREATAAASRDSVIPLPAAQRYAPAGHYPTAYRILWDAAAREYRIALTQLVARP